MTNHQILYLSQADVTKVNLDMATVINLLETAFREKGVRKSRDAAQTGHPYHAGCLHPCHARLYPRAALSRHQVG